MIILSTLNISWSQLGRVTPMIKLGNFCYSSQIRSQTPWHYIVLYSHTYIKYLWLQAGKLKEMHGRHRYLRFKKCLEVIQLKRENCCTRSKVYNTQFYTSLTSQSLLFCGRLFWRKKKLRLCGRGDLLPSNVVSTLGSSSCFPHALQPCHLSVNF